MAVQLVNDIHGKVLRAVSAATGIPFQGLAQASRHRLSGQHLFDQGLRRKLVEIDNAFNVNRHITEPGNNKFFCDIQECLRYLGGSYAGDATCSSRSSSDCCCGFVPVFHLDADEVAVQDLCFCPPIGLIGNGTASTSGSSVVLGTRLEPADAEVRCDPPELEDSGSVPPPAPPVRRRLANRLSGAAVPALPDDEEDLLSLHLCAGRADSSLVRRILCCGTSPNGPTVGTLLRPSRRVSFDPCLASPSGFDAAACDGPPVAFGEPGSVLETFDVAKMSWSELQAATSRGMREFVQLSLEERNSQRGQNLMRVITNLGERYSVGWPEPPLSWASSPEGAVDP